MARKPARPIFHGATPARSPEGFTAAIFGAPHGTPYRGIDNRVHQTAPGAFRKALQPDADFLDSWDFDIGKTLLASGARIADLGDLKTSHRDGKGNRKLIADMTHRCLEAGAIPIMFGGDDSVPIPFIEAFAGGPAITILQIDAHIDWRDERHGETMGFSSTMRRASEQPHVWRIVQAGARGIGSAREREVKDAISWGARLVTAHDMHAKGIEAVLSHIPDEADCVICLDLDAINIAEMPAVVYPTPGGLTYAQVIGLIEGVARKARIAGFSMVEFVPRKDPSGNAAFIAARIACNVVGRLVPHA